MNRSGTQEVRKIHKWIHQNFPHPEKCEECGKKGEKKNGRWTVEFALKRGKKYERKIENYRHLCRACHSKYDFPDGTPGSQNPNWKGGRIQRFCVRCGKEFNECQAVVLKTPAIYCGMTCKNRDMGLKKKLTSHERIRLG